MRLKNIILTDLAHERLIAYEELERIINEKGDIKKTKKKVKKYLTKIVNLNAMIDEWESINQDVAELNLKKQILKENG